MPTWDPDVYQRYKSYRDRPALDLMLRIPRDLAPREIWDLGCGTGEHAALLAARHPDARVHGLDSSAEMLERAKGQSGRVDWVLGDIASFRPEVAPDLIFTNAALQWVGDHATLFPRLMATLAPGGVLACQIPVVLDEGWRRSLRETAGEGPWVERLAKVDRVRTRTDPRDYHDWLSPLSEDLDVWMTTYVHALGGEDPIVDWTSGTSLRPYLEALTDPEEKAAFLAAWRSRLAADYPRRDDGVTLFPFPRLFIVARR
ncbi:MAG: methyltransferase domain-containing protein [Caulobacter sp.]|nr:methyltransferase domain-containing protein [Caulobacter sp.]